MRGQIARAAATFALMFGLAGAFVLSSNPTPANAEITPGKIVGIITDGSTGQPVQGACITVGPPIRCWSYTNAAGQYQIDLQINGSTWDLYILVTGYNQFHSPNMLVNGTVTYNAQLTRAAIFTPSPTATGLPVQTPPAVSPGLPTAAPLPTPAPTPTPVLSVEQRIALFWARVDALQPTDFLAATDIGQWAQNVIDRDPLAGISVTDFRDSTAAMQAAFDKVRVGAPVSGTSDVELRIAQFWQRVDALAPTARLSTTDLGQWGLNVTARDPGARIIVTDFRSSTASMQTAIDRAGH